MSVPFDPMEECTITSSDLGTMPRIVDCTMDKDHNVILTKQWPPIYYDSEHGRYPPLSFDSEEKVSEIMWTVDEETKTITLKTKTVF
uniref:Uncharacterized protein n=1 Tax=Pithovirus LCPAC304 TaxID=2506594 RepID=A0A481Z8B6_9VIRU|nr:MAG: hypothetical protein LCPAC304_04710 [Pithovirus LCPAC304]